MIMVDTNMSFIFNRLGISQSKYYEKYVDMTLDEMIEAEVEEGNPFAIALAKELMENVTLVMELFKMADPKNRLEILRNMSADLMHLFLPLMEPEDLAMGLNFFSMEKLMELMESLPPEQLVKAALEMFSMPDLIKLMPEDQLDKFLESEEIDKNNILKHLMSFQPQYLAQMIESVTGKSCDDQMSIEELMTKIMELNPLEFKNSLKNIQPEQKQKLVLALAKENPELLQLFEPRAYTKIFEEQKDKIDIVKAAQVIDPEHLINMIKELPDDLLALVITQLDPKIFTETLMDEMPEVIAEIMVM